MKPQLFKDHFHQPLNLGKPLFFQTSLNYQMGDLKLQAYLDVNDKDIIQNFAYEYSGPKAFVPYFSALSEMVRGMTLEEGRRVGLDDYIQFFDGDEEFSHLLDDAGVPWCNLATVVLKNLIIDYECSFLTTENERKKQVMHDLVCRCFGVYGKELTSLLEQNPHYELKELQAMTKVGLGCGSCRVEVDELYFNFRDQHPLIKTETLKINSNHRHGDKTTAQWVMLLDKELNVFAQTNGLAPGMLEIIKFKFPILRLKLNTPPEKLSPEKLAEKLIYHLEQTLDLRLTIEWK